MLIAGLLFALTSGLANSTAAALQKREGMLLGLGVRGFRLLAALVRRPWWLLSMGLSVLGWAGQATSLALAPIVAVAPLMGLGRAGLVVIGVRWLGERFGRAELVGVALTVAGAAGAALTSTGTASRAPLPLLTLVALGGLAAIAAGLIARRKTGLSFGVARGLLHAATGVYTKELGDIFVRHGLAGLVSVAALPSAAGIVGLSVVAQVYAQHGMRRANAASVSAASAVFTLNGLVAAGFLLYHEAVPTGLDGIGLALSLVAAGVGTGLLAARAGLVREELAESASVES